MLFTELPVLQRPQAVRDAAFEAIEFVTQFEDLCDVCVGCGYQGKQRAVADCCQANGNRANARGMKVNRGTMALLKPAVRVGVAPALHNGSQSFEAARGLPARTRSTTLSSTREDTSSATMLAARRHVPWSPRHCTVALR